MSWKTKIIIISVILVTIHFLTQGALFALALPNYEYITGKAVCVFGGFIVHPVFDIFGFLVPLPAIDDVFLATAVTTFLAIRVFKSIASKKKKLLAIIISFVSIIYVYKLFGYILIYTAEKYMGQTDCLEVIDLGFVGIKFSWYDPLFLIMTFFALIIFVVSVYKIFTARQAS